MITTSASLAPASRSVVQHTWPGWPYRRKIRRENAPTISSRSAAGSMRTTSDTIEPSRANPSTSSGVYVEPPPTTATFIP
jgi:hypothetical protein